MDEKQVSSVLDGECLTVSLHGEIDHHSAGKIREEIDRDVFFYRAPKVVLDLSNIDFMDSSGLGLILGRYTKIKDLGSVLILKDPTEEIMKILRLSGADKFIQIRKSGGGTSNENKCENKCKNKCENEYENKNKNENIAGKRMKKHTVRVKKTAVRERNMAEDEENDSK